MSSKSHAGFGSRLQNSKDLLAIVKTYTKYAPILDLIKILIYDAFVASVNTAMTPYNTAAKNFRDLENYVESLIQKLIPIVRRVRAVVEELYGRTSEQYEDINEIIDLITGDNISKNTAKRKKEEPAPEPDADFQSVAQVDRGSRLINFTKLIDVLDADPAYVPADADLTVAGLTALRDELSAKLIELATAYGKYTTQRAVILPLFDGPEGLAVRAERAKSHVKSAYGVSSIEYKALTGKIY